MNNLFALPTTMHAMAIDSFGRPDAIARHVLDVPVPGTDEALVRIAAIGVNPADWKACAGFLPFLPESFLPLVPGFDGTGTVVRLGDGGGAFSIGDRIAFMSSMPLGRGGTWADYAICRTDHAVRLPETMTFETAAAIPVAGVSAREALMTQGRVARGERVLVNGGAGGTGIFAIQIAQLASARVAATAGPDNQDLLRALGAEYPIDYRSQDVATRLLDWAPDGVDLVLDTVGQGSLPDAAALLRRGGRYVAIETMLPDERRQDEAAFAARAIHSIRASASYERIREHLAALVTSVKAGTIAVPPIEAMPIAAAAEAMQRVRAGHVRGKIILRSEPRHALHATSSACGPRKT